MKRIINAFIVVFITSLLFSQESFITAAVTPFDDTITAEGEGAHPGNAITAFFEQKLTGSAAFKIRTVNATRTYIEALEKVQLGIEDPRTMKQLGSSLQVDYLVVGSISNLAGGIELDTRLVDINTWKIVHAAGMRKGSALDAAASIVEGFVNLSKQKIDESEKANKDNFTIGIFEFIEHQKNPSNQTYCGILMEMLTGSLGSKALITAIESRFTRQLIEEKQLQMSGVLTNDNSDANFQIAGVQYKLTGDMRVFPDMMTVNYRLFDTSEKRVVFTGSVDMHNSSALRSVARYISKIIEDALNNRIGSLKIATIPSPADIIIDGLSAGKTEKGSMLLTLEKGTYSIGVKLPGYKTHSEAVTIVPRKVTELTIRLEKISEKLFAEAMGLEAMNKFAEAVQKYDEFIKEIGDTPEANVALYRKGHILLINLKEYEKARETFSQLLERYPDAMMRAEGYYGLILTYKEMGNKEMAKSTLKFLLDHYPEAPVADTAKQLVQKL